MIGRKTESERINALLASSRSEFLAITGRRRVGKTFLIDSLLKDAFCFTMTGIQEGSTTMQLTNFTLKLREYTGKEDLSVPKNWQLAFQELKNHLKTLPTDKKHVLFLDELPWIETRKSGFTQMLAHFWNDYLSKEKHFLLVVCGSASSWIVKKVLNDTGGLHNRVTENIHLYPFTLSETQAFLQSKNLQFSIQELTRIYMALGGIPFYLEQIKKGETFATAIERICFSPTGILYNEYNNLYQALFNGAALHQQIVAILAEKPQGISHTEICKQLGITNASGTYQRAMEELQICDFVQELTPFGRQKRSSMYRLIDEFSVFYHHFMKQNRKFTPNMWQQLAESQSYKIWAGYAFEQLCHKHIPAIKQALGIPAVFTETSSLRAPAHDQEAGFQIDLLLDRKDQAINLCEIKFRNGLFQLDKAEYNALVAKRERFKTYTRTKKQVFITLITNHGIAPNAYSQEIVDVELTVGDLVR
jgi:uncharacterized protein